MNSPKSISSQKAQESMKQQQQYQIKENIKYHVEPNNNSIGNISERNTAYYFNKLLNRKLFIYIYIVISFLMLVILLVKLPDMVFPGLEIIILKSLFTTHRQKLLVRLRYLLLYAKFQLIQEVHVSTLRIIETCGGPICLDV